MKPETRELLARYDEPGAYEAPADFRYVKMEAKAQELANRLRGFGLHLTFEGAAHNQDASFSIALLLHDYEQSRNQLLHQPCVRLSNFGNLASITWPSLIPDAVARKIIDTLAEVGFTYIPEAELDCPYDGVMVDKKTFATWWIRYFDWI